MIWLKLHGPAKHNPRIMVRLDCIETYFESHEETQHGTFIQCNSGQVIMVVEPIESIEAIIHKLRSGNHA